MVDHASRGFKPDRGDRRRLAAEAGLRYGGRPREAAGDLRRVRRGPAAAPPLRRDGSRACPAPMGELRPHGDAALDRVRGRRVGSIVQAPAGCPLDLGLQLPGQRGGEGVFPDPRYARVGRASSRGPAPGSSRARRRRPTPGACGVPSRIRRLPFTASCWAIPTCKASSSATTRRRRNA